MKSTLRIVLLLMTAAIVLTAGASGTLAQVPDPGEPRCYAYCDDAPEESSSGDSSSNQGEVWEDPAIAEQRAAEQAAREAAVAAERAEAQAAWQRAATALAALASRGHGLEEDGQAFRRFFDGAGESPALAVTLLVRIPGMGAGPTPGGPRDPSPASRSESRAPPPPVRGLRIREVPPPFTPDRLRPPSEGFSAPGPELAGAPLTRLPDPQMAVEKVTEWLTDTALDEIERRVPGVRQVRSIYETAQQYAQMAQDLSRQNEGTIEGVFRAAGEVVSCNAGAPCDVALVHGLPEARSQEHTNTALDWIHQVLDGGNEDSDDDEER